MHLGSTKAFPIRRADRSGAMRLDGAPGVYVGQGSDGGTQGYAAYAKVAALGLRIRKSRCYHGLSLNVDMDLSPFLAINPCGYAGMAVTQTRDLGINLSLDELAPALVNQLNQQLEQA